MVDEVGEVDGSAGCGMVLSLDQGGVDLIAVAVHPLPAATVPGGASAGGSGMRPDGEPHGTDLLEGLELVDHDRSLT